MTENDEPARAGVEEPELDRLVDGLVQLASSRGRQLRETRQDAKALKAKFAEMDSVALLELAYEALARAQLDMNDDLAALRWEAFGRLAEQIAEASQDPAMQRELAERTEQLREYVFTEELGRLSEPPSPIRKLLRQELRRQLGPRRP